ncbi:hypothetical protein FrCorBMG51_19245 [Protofrankia coriariae]|uniref:Uncharacterized protein n=2 Tax=Frankiaceae TaxID=74712 RepID=A0ABR5F0I6_9ACTN|nr:hypothetical protein FrCorBMG51_19245 [Protofrankia coriariae]
MAGERKHPIRSVGRPGQSTQRKETVIMASHGVTTLLAEATAESHEAPLVWWQVGLVTIGAIVLLGVVIALMTLADRRRHPHP